MNTVAIMSVVGSAVPQNLRHQGLLACWYIVRDGQPISGPLTTLGQAQAVQETLNSRPIH